MNYCSIFSSGRLIGYLQGREEIFTALPIFAVLRAVKSPGACALVGVTRRDGPANVGAFSFAENLGQCRMEMRHERDISKIIRSTESPAKRGSGYA